MRTPEQVKWDFVQQWLDRARKTLITADEASLVIFWLNDEGWKNPTTFPIPMSPLRKSSKISKPPWTIPQNRR
jgi:hypothetical protein